MDLFKIVLGVHIVFGTLALGIAPLAMLTVKGGRWHRRWGKIFFWSMAGIAVTAAVMCWLRTGMFLFLIAILSFYLALTGYRALQRKNPLDTPAWLDLAIAIVLSCAGAAMILVGVFREHDSALWVRVIFGVLSLLLGFVDIRQFFNPPRYEKAWLIKHLTRFMGAYVATVTAFSVVNFQFLPYFWRWIAPVTLGIICVTLCRNYYKRRLVK